MTSDILLTEAPEWAREYDARGFPPYAYTADAVVLAFHRGAAEEERLASLVIRRAGPGPFAGYRAWPGGFVAWEGDVDALAAATRELREETGYDAPPYVETLDTYDAYGRDPRQFAGGSGPDGQGDVRGARVVSKSYLALDCRPFVGLRTQPGEDGEDPVWRSVYRFLPWEDQRTAAGRRARAKVVDALTRWVAEDQSRRTRTESAFGTEAEWNEERAGERFRLLVNAGLVEEGVRDRWGRVRPDWSNPLGDAGGEPMAFDHRIMLADALSRTRGKIKYRPAALRALAGSQFTLVALHGAVEAVAGRPVDKPNFWRLFTRYRTSRLLAPTGRKEAEPSRERGGGPSAEVYRFADGAELLRLDPSIRFPWAGP